MERKNAPAPQKAKAEELTLEEKRAKALLKVIKTAQEDGMLCESSCLEPFIGLSFEKFFTHLPLVVSILKENEGKYSTYALQEFIESLPNVSSTLYEVTAEQEILRDTQQVLEYIETILTATELNI